MNKVRGLLQTESRVYFHRTDFRHTTDIISPQIEQHEMLGAFFFIGQKLGADGFIFSQACAALARSGNRANVYVAVFYTDQDFGAGADNGEVAHIQKEQIGRWVDAAQRAIKVEWRQVEIYIEALAQHDLKHVTRFDIFFAFFNHVEISVLAHI